MTYHQKGTIAFVEILLLAILVTYLFPKAVWKAHTTGAIRGYSKGTSYERGRDGFKFYAMLLYCYVVMFFTYGALYAFIQVWIWAA